jgi:type VI secretion system secreted protein Hcp
MAIDAYLKFTKQASNGNCWPKGESLIEKDAISISDSWSFSFENILDVSSLTTGGGSGKAEFQEFTVKKAVDKASAQLYLAIGAGSHFDDVQLVLRKTTGDTNNASEVFLKWTYNMLVVERVTWSHADPHPEEEVMFRFGACHFEYWAQDDKGKLKQSGDQKWSQIANGPNMTTIG